ncbi:hypothetical protein IV203_023863 [Nitzschia inconspicua]|uniref:Uncharacterized protein n=1 Tax=Nitzschia inconspicua TaxID=303405 RepID=A0A9K3KBU1_9STRA|nr:hypothetical protein IV203_023863 [Nitzschia inconspicua]
MIRGSVALCFLALVATSTTTAFAPNRSHSSKVGSTQQNAVEEVASAFQQSQDMFHHMGVVGPFSDILQGHHPAQFDQDGGIMMTEHLEDPVLKPGRGFVPPTPMKDATKAAAMIIPAAVILEEKKHGRPVPVYYMD